MINSIPPLGMPAVAMPAAPGVQPPADGAAFKDMLLNSIHEVNAMQQQANQAMESFAVGGDVNPVEVLSAVQKADLAFRLMMQVRNKLVEAYQEVQNIRV